MTTAGADARLLRFGAFELDLRHDELRRGGVLIKLSPQQLKVLRYLAERPGQIAAREEIQREVWGGEVFVDFDRSLNVCIAQIRSAMNDDPEAARFIQTVPRRGYRFVAPVESVSDRPEAPPSAPAPQSRRDLRLVIAIATVLELGVGAAIWLRGAHPAPPRVVLAVLPFENVTQRPEDAPAIDGLADELITQFGAALPDRLGVIGRTSVARLAAQKAGVAQIGKELAADYVLEGDLRVEGPRVRISARLVKVAGQAQAWSDTYEMESASRLEMEEEVAARVTAGAAAALFSQTPQAAVRAHVPSREAYEAFVNGRFLQHQRSLADAGRAIGFFEQASQRDPAYAEPWAAMAGTYAVLALAGGAPENLDKARAAAEHALRLNDFNAEAHNALAAVLLWRDWNAAEAKRHFTRAIAINPSFAQAHHDYAFLLIVTGHAEAGVAELRRAIAIDPLSARVNIDAGWLLLQAHRYEEAIAQAKRALALEPDFREAEACIARAEFHRGTASPEMLRFYQSRLQSPDPYQRALAQAIAGSQAEALKSLREAYEKREILMTMVATEPAFASLRNDPGFRDIVNKVWPAEDQHRTR